MCKEGRKDRKGRIEERKDRRKEDRKIKEIKERIKKERQIDLLLLSSPPPSQVLPSISPVPPPSPMHRRSPVPLTAVQDDDDAVSETADSSVIIRMTPRPQGEEVLTVEVAPGDGEEEKKE